MSRQASSPRKTDAKGRVTLGDRFKNSTVLVEDNGDEVVIRLARVVPERELWLHKNKKALGQVLHGLEEARLGKHAKAPDLIAAKKLADELE